MNSTTEFNIWMAQIQQQAEQTLDVLLPAETIAPAPLHTAMRYATLGGGKRVRALLTYAAGGITGAEGAAMGRAAAAVEMIHAYSLIHDDLPCMDDDALRRGKPSTHIQFGESCALLAGDALQSLAFQTLADMETLPDTARQMKMISLLALASGSRGMAGGQALDLAATGLFVSCETLEFMHIHKTGALIRAAVLLGAYCGHCSDMIISALDTYACKIGLLFQVMDDILDAEADTATLGKTAGKDAAQHKSTYVSLLGLNEARRLAGELLAQAQQALAPLGEKSLRLAQLADFIVQRRF